MKLFCIYDRKSGLYGTVFTSENNQTAQRYFQFLCSNPVNELIRDDVDLFVLADYNSNTGDISNIRKEFVCSFAYEESITDKIRNEAIADILKKFNLVPKEDVPYEK